MSILILITLTHTPSTIGIAPRVQQKKKKGYLPAIVLANPLIDRYGIKFTEDELPVLAEALKTGRKAPRAAAAAVAVE